MKKQDIKQGTKCFDCQHEVVDGAVVHVYDTRDGELYKCNECFKKEPKLKDFQKTEVYSRVVGYLRPIDNWNVGKKEEYKDRKEFVI